MWTGPCAVFVPGGSGAELELMLAGSPLPQGMLAAWWEVREATPEPSVNSSFCAHWLSRPYWALWVPRCWSRTLMVGSKLIPPLINVHCPSSPMPPYTGTFTLQGSRAGGRCAGAAPGAGGHACATTLAHWSGLQTLLLWQLSNGCPAPFRCVCVPLCVCVFTFGYLKEQIKTHYW